jgi:dienelactone hydrolase
MKSNRRNFLKLTGLTGIGLAGAGILPSMAKNSESAGSPAFQENTTMVPLNRFPNSVHEYFVKKVKEIEQEAEKKRSSLKNQTDAEAYVAEIREKIQKCFGSWPEKTPLNAKVIKRVKKENYYIENITFESRPGFTVTANLYIPMKKKMPVPGVVCACGHTDNGKIGYQSLGQGLARIGYVALVFDPIGQGERLQFPTKDLKSETGIGVLEHLYAGNPLFLVGDSMSAWFTWDGIRAIDYLLTRKEVNPEYIGVTGVSGGGTQTTWTCGADRRITMGAPACFVTTFLTNLENEEVADTEQIPPKALGLGLDHSDFLGALAPNPAIILSQENDFFDVRGAEISYQRLQSLYKLLGQEENIQLNVGPGGHSYPKESREAMYAHFNRLTKASDNNTEPELVMENPENLLCSPKGQVVFGGSRKVFDFRREKSLELKSKRQSLQGEDLKKAIRDLLKMPATEGTPHYRILRSGRTRNYPIQYAANYVVETEPGIHTLVYRLDDKVIYGRPPKGKRAILYVSHMSSDDELRNEPMIAEIIKNEPGAPVFTCDVRGIGESKPNSTRKTFQEPYGVDYFYAAYSILLDYPYAGQKTYDILRVIDWMKSFGYDDIHLIARGYGSIPATFAALLSDSVRQVTLKNSLTSYSDIAESERYNWPLSTFLPDVLKVFDLPDCYKALESKKLRIVDAWDAMAGK